MTNHNHPSAAVHGKAKAQIGRRPRSSEIGAEAKLAAEILRSRRQRERVFGANLFSALGAGNGVQQAGQTGNIKVIAFDAPTSIVANIKDGLVDAAIAQHPAEIGYYGVVSAFAHLSGQSIPVSIGTGFTILDHSKVDDPNVAKYVYSD